ncbi:MAG: glycosyl transferase [Candidatus Saccharibacteria bacterium]|nr:glycosyl transferase [Candidatus Saccharibacteria bacterium]
MADNTKKLQVAVIVPCYNEAQTIKKVVKDFKKALPGATIFVFDNNSSDETSRVAREAGAEVRFVALPGKGNVVRRMFADVDADVYLMVDGDATYDAASAPKMVQRLVDENLDMVVGCRTEQSTDNENYRPGHRIGNKLLTGSVQKMFSGNFTDMLSGYRVFSRRYAKSFTADSKGFETETELTVHALEMRMPFAEVMTPYFERPEGSESKLSTYKDGIKILKMILRLYSNERPLRFWGIIGSVFLILAIILSVPILIEFAETREVARFPTLIASTAISIASLLFFTIGLVLRTVTKGRKETNYLMYLAIPSVRSSVNSNE